MALVIGSGAYPAQAALPNAVQDAALVAARLETLGYSVVSLANPTREEVLRALAILQVAAQEAQQVVVYLSGHGGMQRGAAYYLTVDAVPSGGGLATSDFDMASVVSALPVSIFAKALSDRPRQKIIFFDACRTPSGLRMIQGAVPLLSWPAGVTVAYASAPGSEAYDGSNGRSPFAQAFLRHVTAEAPALSDVLRMMRLDVVTGTQGAQVPWVQTSMLTKVFLQIDAPN
ncbi:caspase family protein [Shimia sp.]|uniref:caspase family protein n=1 Tax=Shimia sp. TaxID=1954381 RepID=UPI003B8DD874